MRKPLNALIVSSLLLTISQSFASDNRLPLPDQTLIKAEKVNLHFAQAPAPQGLVENLKKGGYVIVFRYTGAGGSQTPVESQVHSKVIDDGQRISDKRIDESLWKKIQRPHYSGQPGSFFRILLRMATCTSSIWPTYPNQSRSHRFTLFP